VHPTATPADLGARLTAAGLEKVELMTFMALDLLGWHAPAMAPPPGVEVTATKGETALEEYTRLTVAYWEVPPDEAPGVAAMQRAIAASPIPGVRFLAHVDGRAIGKAYLSTPGPEGVASLYGMSVRPEARGRGIAVALTVAVLARAQNMGFERLVLHATDMAVTVYRRLGFATCATADVHATAPVWTNP
jgi:ribosomal protein S18 acetylase RimI-like enzyme